MNPHRWRPRLRDIAGFVLGASLVAALAGLAWWRIPVAPQRLHAALLDNPEFLADRPELLEAARAVLQTRQLASRGSERAAQLSGKWDAFTHVAFSPSIGNPGASSVLIEFTDYTCEPCRSSAPVVREALAANPDLRVAIMLLPAGGAMSEFAARVALAAFRQDPEKFGKLHELLMEDALDQTTIMGKAAAAGLDVEQIRREIGNVEHRRYLEQVRALALDLQVTGVPAFALGEQLVLGGVTARKLGQMIGAGRAGPPAHDTYTAQRSFSLVDQHGTAVSARDFLGEWLLVTFGFTQCPDVCPMSMSRLATAVKLLDADARQLRVALITVDPERDTPEVLARYVAAFDTRFVGLTGSPQQVAAATAAFGAYAAPQAADADGSYAVNHSSAFYLIDPRGRFSRQLSSETSPEQLAASLKKIINAE